MPNFSDIVSQNTVGATAVLAVGHKITLTAIRAQNLTAADAYLQLFDAALAADVTVGTTVATWWVQSDANDPSVDDGLPNGGLVFQNGVVIASTTTSTGNTGANQHVRLGIQ